MDQSGELELQWDIVENQEDISSSLEEIYGYEVFSEKFYNETKSISNGEALEYTVRKKKIILTVSCMEKQKMKQKQRFSE